MQAREGDEDDKNVGIVGQQGLLPTAQDARLWAVQCRGGFEREAVVCIMTKAAEYAARSERLGMAALGIKAVFCQDHLPVRSFCQSVRELERGFEYPLVTASTIAEGPQAFKVSPQEGVVGT